MRGKRSEGRTVGEGPESSKTGQVPSPRNELQPGYTKTDTWTFVWTFNPERLYITFYSRVSTSTTFYKPIIIYVPTDEYLGYSLKTRTLRGQYFPIKITGK